VIIHLDFTDTDEIKIREIKTPQNKRILQIADSLLQPAKVPVGRVSSGLMSKPDE
jgi:hypothetical protein